MLKPLIVIGAGGLATQMIDDLETQFGNDLCLIDDVSETIPSHLFGFRVVDRIDKVEGWRAGLPFNFIVANGSSVNRLEMMHTWQQRGGLPIKLLSRHALISSKATIFPLGCIVLSKVVVEAAASVGIGCLINVGAHIHHHVQLGHFVTVGPGAILLGRCKVGAGTEIGAGAIILPKISVGANCIIGAGAVVTHHLPDGVIAKGMPANFQKIS
jgi:sugar O-acyltransferase (sialic acid O-acetyltransferase NeuD family)